MPSPTKFSHLNALGQAQMVDVSNKPETVREARAEALVRMQADTLRRLMAGDLPKGDVFAVARIAGISAAKRTHELIPLCHALALSAVDIEFSVVGDDAITIHTRCKLNGRTGVEMEALTAASIAALTLYDMCKAVDRGMRIEQIRLIEKSGGGSGHFQVAMDASQSSHS